MKFHKYLIALTTLMCVTTQAQVITNIAPTITELRVTRSDTGESLLFSSLLAKDVLNPLAPTTFDSAIKQARLWANECKCRVYVRDSLFFDGKVLLSSSSVSNSSVRSSISYSSVKSSLSSSNSSYSSSKSSVSSSSSSIYQPSNGESILTGLRPFKRVGGEDLPLDEISEYWVWYDETNYDIIPSEGDEIKYVSNFPRTSTSQWRIQTKTTDGQWSELENILM